MALRPTASVKSYTQQMGCIYLFIFNEISVVARSILNSYDIWRLFWESRPFANISETVE